MAGEPLNINTGAYNISSGIEQATGVTYKYGQLRQIKKQPITNKHEILYSLF